MSLQHDGVRRIWNNGPVKKHLTSSIYYLLDKLEGKELIEQVPANAGKQKKRPKKVYQTTEKGRSAWKEATLEALRQPRTTYTNFLMGVHNLWNIPPAEALEAVKTYHTWLEGDLQRQRGEQTQLEELGVSHFPLQRQSIRNLC